MNFKIIALLLLGIRLIYDLFLNICSYRSKNNPIPQNVSDIYDKNEYLRWQSYHKEQTRTDIIYNSVDFIAHFTLISLNIPALAGASCQEKPYLSMIFVLLIFNIVSSIISTVFSYIYSMKIDDKYGFNKMTLKTFISDCIKSFVISTFLLIGIACILILIHTALGDWLPVLFASALIILILITTFLYPYFSRLFNKFTPLEDGELRTKLTRLLEKNGYTVKEIQVMDASKRTTKSNAYFSGMGKTKTIVLFDTLVASMSSDEIVAVFAHELGHGLHKDIAKNSVFSFLQMAIIAVMAWLTVRFDIIYQDFGFSCVNYGLALFLVMSIEFPIISPIMSMISGEFSRKAEYRADEHAVNEGYGRELIESLKKLSKEDLTNLSPSKVEVVLTYSHPPLSQRIEAIEKKLDSRKKQNSL